MVQVLVRVPAAERQKQQQQQQQQQGTAATSKPHFELLEGCRPETTVADLKRQLAARGYASGSFDLPPRSQRLCLAGRALADDAETLKGLGLAEAFVEQVAGFVVFDAEEEDYYEEGKEEKKKKET